MKENIEIRNKAKENRIAHWEIAEGLGVSEQTFCRMMRRELPKDKQNFIIKEIERIVAYKRNLEAKHYEE